MSYFYNWVNVMVDKDSIEEIRSELQKGMSLAKCRKCGCMKDALENLSASLSSLQFEDSLDLLQNVELWQKQMEPIKYACLGCTHCFAAVATNVFNKVFPEIPQAGMLSCAFEVKDQVWPPVPGEYFAFCDGSSCPVAVSTLASVELSERLANLRPKELCIVGKTETENIGIDKVIKNTITNPTIRFLILAGRDSEGHRSGETFLALKKNGVDENMRVISSPGQHPFLRNVTKGEVETFRKQVQVVDMIGCEDTERIAEKTKELFEAGCEYEEHAKDNNPFQIPMTPVLQAKEPTKIEMDKAGYWVIIPQAANKIIIVEHYSYDNKLLRVIEGDEARKLYWTIIQNGWVSQLSHAAYLGKELEKAELSIKLGFKYIQDRA